MIVLRPKLKKKRFTLPCPLPLLIGSVGSPKTAIETTRLTLSLRLKRIYSSMSLQKTRLIAETNTMAEASASVDVPMEDSAAPPPVSFLSTAI